MSHLNHLEIVIVYPITSINSYAIDQAYFEKMWEEKIYEAIGTKHGTWTLNIQAAVGIITQITINGESYHALSNAIYAAGNTAFQACCQQDPLLKPEPIPTPQAALVSPAFLRAMTVAELEALLIDVQNELANRDPKPAHVQP